MDRGKQGRGEEKRRAHGSGRASEHGDSERARARIGAGWGAARTRNGRAWMGHGGAR